MKSVKIAVIMTLLVIMSVMGLEKASTPKTDAELLQIQNTLQEVGREHLAAQKHLGPTVATSIQNQLTELKNKLDSMLSPEQRAKIKSQIEQIKLNIKKYVTQATA